MEKHARRGWGIAIGVTAIFAARLASEFGDSVITRAIIAGCTVGVVALVMQKIHNAYESSSLPDESSQ
jgi:hypothetical protein